MIATAASKQRWRRIFLIVGAVGQRDGVVAGEAGVAIGWGLAVTAWFAEGAVKPVDGDEGQAVHADEFGHGIQVMLREVQTDSLVLALKGTTEDLRQKIFRNMSSRAAEALKEDLESRGPVKVAEVEAQQKEILKIVRRLGEEGQIQLGGKGEDSYV